MGSVCENAWARYNDSALYTAYTSLTYTSLTYTNGANAAFTGEGCSAFFECSGAYPAAAVFGAELKTAFGLLGFNVCGWHNLSMGGYDVRLDACSGCVDWVDGVELEPVSPCSPEPWCDHSKC